MLLRRSFDAVGGYDEALRLAEDYDLWNRMAEHGRFVFVNEVTVRRRIHAAQTTSRFESEILQTGWMIRRRTAARRLATEGPRVRNHLTEVLGKASHRSVESVIYHGQRRNLALIRSELEETDRELESNGGIARVGGSGRIMQRLIQNSRCTGRALLNEIGRASCRERV